MTGTEQGTGPEHPAPTTADALPCERCGAPLSFAPDADALRCAHCGACRPIAQGDAAAIVEHDLTAALAKAKRVSAATLARDGTLLACQGCGATTLVTGPASHCAFCGSPLLPATGDLACLVPESLLPFAVPRERVAELFSRWVRSRWFAPDDLRAWARTESLLGSYLPYFTYDSRTTTRYTGARGVHYAESVRVRGADGRMHTRMVTKTRWYPASGIVHVDFDDVLVCASASLPEPLVRTLEPWDLAALRPYEPDYLRGFVAERATLEIEAGFALAEARMQPAIAQAIRRDIGGDVQVIHRQHITHRDTRWKHLLLPLWIATFRYRDRVFRVVCNARTGEVTGERPYSVAKIAAAVFFALLVVSLVAYLVSRTTASAAPQGRTPPGGTAGRIPTNDADWRPRK